MASLAAPAALTVVEIAVAAAAAVSVAVVAAAVAGTVDNGIVVERVFGKIRRCYTDPVAAAAEQAVGDGYSL